MAEQLSWPIVVMSTTNTFLHVGTDLKSLQDHIVDDTRRERADPQQALTLEFLDSAGRVVEPVPSQAWLPVEFRVTAYSINQATLLQRIRDAIVSGENYARALKVKLDGKPLSQADINHLTGPKPAAGDTIAGFLTILVNHPSYTEPELAGVPDPTGRGGWLHNAWHAAFG